MLFHVRNAKVGELMHIHTGRGTNLYGINFAVPAFKVFACDGHFGKHLLSDCTGPLTLISFWS